MKYTLILDLECCCWEPKDYTKFGEIIEIGITKMSSESREIFESESVIVRPTTEYVSDFCTSLTTLTPKFVDENGIAFKDAVKYVAEKYDTKNTAWASYGQFDQGKLIDQCRREKIEYPFSTYHTNVKEMVTNKFQRKMGMAEALKRFGMPLEGTHHRGSDDSRNIAKILLKML